MFQSACEMAFSLLKFIGSPLTVKQRKRNDDDAEDDGDGGCGTCIPQPHYRS